MCATGIHGSVFGLEMAFVRPELYVVKSCTKALDVLVL